MNRRWILKTRYLVVVAVVFGSFCRPVAQGAERNASYLAAMSSIRSSILQSHVDVLADDDLEGRKAGTPGGRAAGDYIVSRLRELGLQGAGTEDDYSQPFGNGYRNILACVEGSDSTLGRQYVVVGAHYDHVGLGTRYNSLGTVGRIHNGADDNASGVSGLLALAEALAMLPEPPRRSILLVAWDAEEKGLLGSKHWLAHPTVPLEQIVSVLNMDMVGRLREDRLIVIGSRTGYGWRRLVSMQNQGPDLMLDFSWGLQPNADHYPFFERKVPVLMLHTGLHDQYHRPTDDADLINPLGMQRVIRFMFGVLYASADQDVVPGYRETARRESDKSRQTFTGFLPARLDRLGVGWQSTNPKGQGVRLSHITWGSPAHKGTLREGDCIVRFDGKPIRTSSDLVAAVTLAQSPATVVFQRPDVEQPIELSVSLDGPPMRLGIRWQLDDAEPGTLMLTQVIPGSPAERAGLAVGDRIYQIAGHDFADSAEFTEWTRTLPGPIKLTVERDGRIRSVEIHFQNEASNRAA